MSIFISKNFSSPGFVNPAVDSDNQDDNIFKPERHFPDVFNGFVN